jgi:hypothetical protein
LKEILKDIDIVAWQRDRTGIKVAAFSKQT